MSRKSAKKSGKQAAGNKRAGRKGGEEGREAPQDEAPRSLPRRIWDQVGPLGIAILLALAIRAVIIESYYVPSGSMLPTMFIGDHVFVSKFAFGARIPFTSWTLPALRDPERGEIVVFALGRRSTGEICPLDKCPDYPEEGFVKRIAAIPGDTVEYRNGVFYLNGAPAEQRNLDETFTDEHGIVYRVREEDLDGCVHRILDQPQGLGLTQRRVTVPPDHYFMLGDNRDNSNDSRGWGMVDRANLKGPVLVNYWAWNNHESWLAMLNPLTWVRLLWGEMYWGRIGKTYSCRE